MVMQMNFEDFSFNIKNFFYQDQGLLLKKLFEIDRDYMFVYAQVEDSLPKEYVLIKQHKVNEWDVSMVHYKF